MCLKIEFLLRESNQEIEMSGWSDLVASEKDVFILWHWIWCESGWPNADFIYDIMKRTRHQYHYAVRYCKKNKLRIQKEKLANNISHTKDFWKELK